MTRRKVVNDHWIYSEPLISIFSSILFNREKVCYIRMHYDHAHAQNVFGLNQGQPSSTHAVAMQP